MWESGFVMHNFIHNKARKPDYVHSMSNCNKVLQVVSRCWRRTVILCKKSNSQLAGQERFSFF